MLRSVTVQFHIWEIFEDQKVTDLGWLVGCLGFNSTFSTNKL